MISVLRFRYFFTTLFLIIGFVLWLTYPRFYEFNGSIFGTYYKVILVAPRHAINNDKVSTLIKAQLESIDQLFSTYRSDSEVMKLNQAPINQPFTIDEEVVELIQLSKSLQQTIGPVWDPTIVPVSKKYGFETVPGITGAVIGLQHLDILNDNQVIKHAAISIDFSSIAKGYAVDKLSMLVNEFKIKGSYIDIGGEIRTTGQKAGLKPWGIGIQSPTNTSELAQVIYTNNIAIATSGNYLNYLEKNEKVIGHILDPRTKAPVEHELLSASIIAKECAIADAVATGVFVMGPELAKEWLNTHTNYPALLIYYQNNEIITEFMNGFDRFLDPSMNLSF